ncbi:MAG: hypothetical protein A2511_03115, partial [Deltaproteobacteria bacterium RIFOXYD12_FULL_50_9]
MVINLEDLEKANAELFARHVKLDLWKKARGLRRSGRMEDILTVAESNVHATGIGRKLVNGRATKDYCVQLFVYRKLPLRLLPRHCILPKEIAALPTDVVVSPPLRPCGPPPVVAECQPQTRPLKPGISTSHFNMQGGSIGCFCKSARPGADPNAVYLLSNNHVLAACNAASKGDDIYQPSCIHCGALADTVAKLADFVPLRFGQANVNNADCAAALLEAGVDWSNVLPGGVTLGTPVAPVVDMKVRQTGARTGTTEGRILSINHRFPMDYITSNGLRTAVFVDQIRIQVRTGKNFALEGDSGAIVYRPHDGRAVGLLFAATEDGNI